MDRKAVKSTNVLSVGYDAKTSTLEVEFKSGGIYHYSGVPEARYNKLMKASAIGSYLHREIKPWYVCKRIT